MTCRRARKELPLFAGQDLPPRRMAKVERHLHGCAGCRTELEELRRAMARIKEEAAVGRPAEWSADEWRAALALAVQRGRRGPGEKERETISGIAPLPRWVGAAAVGAVAGLLFLAIVLRDFPRSTLIPGPPHERAAQAVREDETWRGQDIVELRLHSQETGLAVVWVLNRNFRWKGDER